MNIKATRESDVAYFFGRSQGAGNRVTSNQPGGPTNSFCPRNHSGYFFAHLVLSGTRELTGAITVDKHGR